MKKIISKWIVLNYWGRFPHINYTPLINYFSAIWHDISFPCRAHLCHARENKSMHSSTTYFLILYEFEGVKRGKERNTKLQIRPPTSRGNFRYKFLSKKLKGDTCHSLHYWALIINQNNLFTRFRLSSQVGSEKFGTKSGNLSSGPNTESTNRL